MNPKIISIAAALALSLLISTSSVFAMPGEKPGEQGEGMTDEIAVDFVNQIRNHKDGSDHLKTVSEQSKKVSGFASHHRSDRHNPFGRQTYIHENDELRVEVDEVGKPITFENKNKIVSRGARYEGHVERYNFLVKKDRKVLDAAANTVADALSPEKRKFHEVDEMSDGYTAYKWKRTYNGYPYDFDFVMVIVDPVDGDTACASKRFVSNEPTNSVKLDERQAKKLGADFVQKQLPGVTQILLKSEIKVVNLPSTETATVFVDVTTPMPMPKFNPETKLAYALTYKKDKPYPGETEVWIDAENGQFVGMTTTN